MSGDNKVSNMIGAIKGKKKDLSKCHIKWKLKFVRAKRNSYRKKLRYMTVHLSTPIQSVFF